MASAFKESVACQQAASEPSAHIVRGVGVEHSGRDGPASRNRFAEAFFARFLNAGVHALPSVVHSFSLEPTIDYQGNLP
jgi:hypothetical protein